MEQTKKSRNYNPFKHVFLINNIPQEFESWADYKEALSKYVELGIFCSHSFAGGLTMRRDNNIKLNKSITLVNNITKEYLSIELLKENGFFRSYKVNDGEIHFYSNKNDPDILTYLKDNVYIDFGKTFGNFVNVYLNSDNKHLIEPNEDFSRMNLSNFIMGKGKLKKFLEEVKDFNVKKETYEKLFLDLSVSNGCFDILIKDYRRRFNVPLEDILLICLQRKIT